MSDSKRSKPKNQPQDGTVVQFPTTTEPFSLEAEQSILGGLMFDDSEWSLIQAILSAEDFFLPEHRIIFTAIKSVIAKDQHPDPITLTDHLQAESNFKTIGSNNYLSTLTKTLQQNSVASNL
ncbi:protein containing DNA helicase, DnaB-like protein, partial [Candidatus Thiomargarita nelsonii]